VAHGLLAAADWRRRASPAQDEVAEAGAGQAAVGVIPGAQQRAHSRMRMASRSPSARGPGSLSALSCNAVSTARCALGADQGRAQCLGQQLGIAGAVVC
jgi:hypothetical protein